MDFDLSEDQKEIKSVAHELLGARSTWTRVREAAVAGEYDDSLWREVVELGWTGIAVRESAGGQELGIVELAVLCEELGYVCAAVPFLSTAVVAAVIDRCGTDDERERWLPGLLDGSVRAGLGRPGLLADGAGASVAVIVDVGVASLVTGFEAEPLVSIDPTRRFASLVAGSGDARELDPAAAALVTTALAAELVGVSQRALEMSLEYVRDRKQFGVPVGSFQAVAHRCAEMLFNTESARSAAYYAAWAADVDDSPDAEAARPLAEAAALAGAAGAIAGREVAASAIQAHGGIGFTWEADVHWLYKRGEVDRSLIGGAGVHRAALARAAAARVVGAVAVD